jgi:pimeloyl-ACP methyl ester carboxylesterase
MRRTRTTAFTLLLLVLLKSSHAQTSAPSTDAVHQRAVAAVTKDATADPAHPASMVEWSIPSRAVNMNAALYLASGAGPHGLAILLHGFPGYERNQDLAQSIRRAGWHALVFHYRGAWGSDGNFSFANAMDDTDSAVAYVRSPAVAAKYGIDPKRIVLIGHSMGGFMAAHAASRESQVAGVILLAAWNIGGNQQFDAAHEKNLASEFSEELRPLKGCTPQSLVAEIKQHGKTWDYVTFAPALKSRPVLVVSTNDDLRPANEALYAALQKSGATRAKYLHFDTDHGFSDKRIAMQIAVIDWLLGM